MGRSKQANHKALLGDVTLLMSVVVDCSCFRLTLRSLASKSRLCAHNGNGMHKWVGDSNTKFYYPPST